MSDLEQQNTDQPLMQDELASLKARADLLGVSYHPSIGVDKLRDKIAAKLNDQPDPDATVGLNKPAESAQGAEETDGQKRKRSKDEALKLVRVNITCMNPAKKEWGGEIFTVGNDLVGTVKKFVPFNTPDGWHVPAVLLQMIRDREFQSFVTERTKHGVPMKVSRISKEFAVHVLDPLTPEELRELAQRQAMAAGQNV